MNNEQIDTEFNAFFEFPTADKTQVSSVSCKLFAKAIVDAVITSQAQHSQWISVEERLPEVKVESFEFYLVTTLNLKTKKQSVSEAAFLNEMELYSDDHDHDPQLFSGWHNAKESKDYDGWYEPLGNENCKVTHWMPLPLPPEPDGDKP